MLELNKIYNMDCLEGMKLIDDNSIDSIVTDPPYELGFMGKSWDSTGIAYNIELWKECLRVLKHGGHLLAFGGTRTYHRMVCAIEDAGFEIRDQMQWIYGSGFPKSYNIAKGIEGKLLHGNANTTNYKNLAKKNEREQGMGFNDIHLRQGDRPASYKLGGVFDLDATTPEAKQWDGWGTALKPANEPIVVARKPLSEKTVAENVLKWGTGGINIDGCRIESGGEHKRAYQPTNHERGVYGKQTAFQPSNKEGRFPANVILDEEAGKMLDEQSGISKGSSKPRKNKGAGNICYGDYKTIITQNDTWGDTGGASRFFYCAKASKKERGEGNTHPTVKPLKLISYLITLVTPPNGICLDIFEGSGTHALACIENGFKYIGFELEKKYYDIATERIADKMAQISLFYGN